MNKIKFISLTAGVALAMAFTFIMSICSCGSPPKRMTIGEETVPPVTNAEIVLTSFTDSRDGKTYKAVKIGEQTWMAENLNYDVEGNKCYDNSPANCKKYGRLYSWYVAVKVCPSGWHLPSEQEWQTLVNLAGGGSHAGARLKTASGWNKNGNGTDNYGFSALPGGYYDGSFNGDGSHGAWWSATDRPGLLRAYYYGMNYGNSSAGRGDGHSTSTGDYFSVRCVQD